MRRREDEGGREGRMRGGGREGRMRGDEKGG